MIRFWSINISIIIFNKLSWSILKLKFRWIWNLLMNFFVFCGFYSFNFCLEIITNNALFMYFNLFLTKYVSKEKVKNRLHCLAMSWTEVLVKNRESRLFQNKNTYQDRYCCRFVLFKNWNSISCQKVLFRCLNSIGINLFKVSE